MEEVVYVAKAVRKMRKLGRAGVWIIRMEATPLTGGDHISSEDRGFQPSSPFRDPSMRAHSSNHAFLFTFIHIH